MIQGIVIKNPDKLTVLNELVINMSSAVSINDVISVATKSIIESIGSDIVFFFVLRQGSLELLQSWQHPGVESTIRHEEEKVGICLCGIAAQGRPFYSINIHNDPLCTLAECKKADLHSFAAMPLKYKDDILGVLAVGSFSERDFKKQNDLLEILATHIAIALKTAILNDELQNKTAMLHDRVGELAALHAIGHLVNASLCLEQISSAVLRGMLEAVKPDLAFMFLREGERLVLQDVLPREAQQRMGTIPEHIVGECMCGLAVRDGQPLYSRDIHSDLRCTWHECKKAGIKSFAALPIGHGEENIGVIGLASLTERDFNVESDFLKTLAIQVSASLANARLLETARRELAERKQAENEILRERDFSTSALNSLPGVFYLFDQDGKFLRWNKNFELLTEYTSEEISQMHPLDLFVGQDRSLIQERIQDVFVKGSSDAEAEIVSKSGKHTPCFFTGLKMYIEGKSCLIGVGIDITDRKRTEEEHRKLQAQLQHAQKMESVGLLAGGMAHDFNNMLTAILGYTELAMMGCTSSEPIHANLRAIEKAALRSADLVRQLLAFARRQTVAPKVLTLNDTLSGMLQMLQRLIGEDIDFAWIPGTGLWPVKIDPSQIDQLLANLCVNARDALSGVGKITIETDNRVFDEAYCAVHLGFVPGEYVMLAVSDNGCGMDKDVLEHIFEPFYTTKELGKGTGLGLATVYGIVRQNNGFINVYSEPGNGTTFKIYLPRHAWETVVPIATSTAEIPKGCWEMVLLVEDEALILNMSKVMLEDLGYKVLTAGTPGEALRQAKTNADEIQLLITDVVMPDMNGRDLAKLLRGMNPRMKCLFSSGYTANVIAHRGVLDEGVHFLQKPYSIRDLAIKVREALELE